jgi:hypothetical protein
MTELNAAERQALGEYLIRQQQAGRNEIPIGEIEIAIAAIKAASDTLPIAPTTVVDDPREAAIARWNIRLGVLQPPEDRP